MNNRIAALVLLLTGVPHSVSAQAIDCEELVREADSIQSLRNQDPAAGAQRGLELLARSDWPDAGCASGAMLLNAAVASNLYVMGRNEEAIEAVEAALELARTSEDQTTVASVHRTAGVIYWEIGSHDRALQHYLVALRNSRAAGDEDGAARVAGNIGNLQNSLGNWDEARRYHLQALEGFERTGWREGVAGTLVNLGALSARLAAAHAEAGDPSASEAEHRANLDYNRRALALFEELGNARGIAYAGDNIARALIELGRVDEALVHHRRSLQLRRELGDVTGMVNSLLTGARAHLAVDRTDEALSLLDEAESQVPDDVLDLLRVIVQLQVEVLERRGDYAAAFDRLQYLMELRDEQAALELAARVEELQEDFRAEQLEQQLELERTRAELSEQRTRRQRLISAGALVSSVFLLLILGLLYSRYRLGQRASKRLEQAARTDPLTGLSNRRDMAEQIRRASRRKSSDDEPVSLIMADIDNFKQINDTLGHAVGDEVLVHIAGLIRQQVRGVDVTARWGGEEFLILLPGTNDAGARIVAEKLRQVVAEAPLQKGEGSLVLTMTLGVAEVEPGMAMADLIKRADKAMYLGKVRGKNQVVSFGEVAE